MSAYVSLVLRFQIGLQNFNFFAGFEKLEK